MKEIDTTYGTDLSGTEKPCGGYRPQMMLDNLDIMIKFFKQINTTPVT